MKEKAAIAHTVDLQEMKDAIVHVWNDMDYKYFVKLANSCLIEYKKCA